MIPYFSVVINSCLSDNPYGKSNSFDPLRFLRMAEEDNIWHCGWMRKPMRLSTCVIGAASAK